MIALTDVEVLVEALLLACSLGALVMAGVCWTWRRYLK